jgi:cytochrome c-type biogenesis protein CcmF
VNELLSGKAEPWSYTVGIAGQSFIFLAIALCLGAAAAMLFARERLGQRLLAFGALSFFGAFVCLFTLFATHQYQFKYVFDHAARDHERQYLFAAVWSGQEGSFLLWGLMSALVGAIAARGAGELRRWFTVVYGLFLASLAAINAYETPFALLQIETAPGVLQHFVPPDGMGLNSQLLNYWMVIHPPTIFLGFGTLTVLFAMSFAAVLRRDLVSWVPIVRPWALFSLAVLGLGLSMGGFWAYETLGWGGFWAWDPVENTSFVPWCAVIAFVHGLFVQQARKKWHIANAVFAALPFLLFCWGTLLTRSGWLGETSVHSFAQMNPWALRLLVSLSAVGAVAFVAALVANWRHIRSALPSAVGSRATWLNKEVFYGVGIWLLLVGFALVTAIGMSMPAIMRASGKEPKVVEEGLYHHVLVWFFPPFMLAMAIAPFLNWKGLTFRELFSRITNSLAVSIGMVGVILLWMKSSSFHAPGPDETVFFFKIGSTSVAAPKVTWLLVLTWLCLFVAVAAFWRMMDSIKKSTQTVAAMLAHFGLAVALLGLVFSRGFQVKTQVLLHESEDPTAFGYTLEAKEQTSQFSDRDNKIPVVARSPDGSFIAKPGLYYFAGRDGTPTPMVWPAIVNRWLYDYYFTLYEPVFEATGLTSFELSDDSVANPDTKAHRDVVLMYTGYAVEGSVADDGKSVLTAKFTAVTDEAAYEVEPKIVVTLGEGAEPLPAKIGDRYRLVLHGMDPETHAVQVTLEYVQPAYPMEVFFKPLTLFVWLGVGIMTLGGLLSAHSRRKERLAIDDGLEATPEG